MAESPRANPALADAAAGLSLDAAGFAAIDGQPLTLPPKERAVLRLLIERRPAVVSKDDFSNAAWPQGGMSDESLARCISRVRRELARHRLRVEAVYGTGYRLLDAAAEPAPPPGASNAGPQPQPIEACEHARRLLRQRTPLAVHLAIDVLRGVIRDDPGFAPARVALAEALAAAVGWGQLPTLASVDEGLAALTAVSAPGVAAARGALLDMAWRFDEATAAFDQALRADPEHPETLYAHGRHLLFIGQPERAIETLRLARDRSPHNQLLRINLSRALLQAGRGNDALSEAQAAVKAHPGELFVSGFALAIQAMVAPTPELEAAARRLGQGLETPPFAWSILTFVLARLNRREEVLNIVDAVLMCSSTTVGEASLYAAPLAAIGEFDKAGDLLQRAFEERSGMLAMVLRDPAHAGWLPQHTAGRALLDAVFGTRGAEH